MPAKKRKAAPETATALKLRHSRPQGWRGSMVTDEMTSGSVSVKAIVADDSFLPADSPILWSVGVTIHHDRAAQSLYLPTTTGQYANPRDHVLINVDIAHPRGAEDGRSRGTTIECELAHLDTLVEALSAALLIGRRDGTLPVAKGIKPWPHREQPKGFLRTEPR
ncbi:MAG: hypothetical protein Q7S20_01345 [Gemmatimonadaceae bacterium]|nr:hypothetical protein [Gemmatimonadaceae bacterium]